MQADSLAFVFVAVVVVPVGVLAPTGRPALQSSSTTDQ